MSVAARDWEYAAAEVDAFGADRFLDLASFEPWLVWFGLLRAEPQLASDDGWGWAGMPSVALGDSELDSVDEVVRLLRNSAAATAAG